MCATPSHRANIDNPTEHAVPLSRASLALAGGQIIPTPSTWVVHRRSSYPSQVGWSDSQVILLCGVYSHSLASKAD